jgi:large subunit ribosomal protein L35
MRSVADLLRRPRSRGPGPVGRRARAGDPQPALERPPAREVGPRRESREPKAGAREQAADDRAPHDDDHEPREERHHACADERPGACEAARRAPRAPSREAPRQADQQPGARRHRDREHQHAEDVEDHPRRLARAQRSRRLAAVSCHGGSARCPSLLRPPAGKHADRSAGTVPLRHTSRRGTSQARLHGRRRPLAVCHTQLLAMPKMKSHSGASKRFKLTGSGKVRGRHAFTSHILEKKSPKRKRRLGAPAAISANDAPRVKKLLGG